MEETQTIFENEEAARLLNYFILYKEIVNKNDKTSNEITLEVLPKPEALVLRRQFV